MTRNPAALLFLLPLFLLPLVLPAGSSAAGKVANAGPAAGTARTTAPRAPAAVAFTDRQLRRLITSACWGTFSNRSAWSKKGVSPSGQPARKFSFLDNGTYTTHALGKPGISSPEALSEGAPADAGGGRWEIRQGRMLVSWGEGVLQEQELLVECTRKEFHLANGLAPFLLGPGGDFSLDGSGVIQCACGQGGYPVLIINGRECLMRSCD